MFLKNLFDEWASESPLFEMAFQRKNAINTLLHMDHAFGTHLLKVLLWSDQQPYQHWISELNGYCDKFDELWLKPNRKKLEGSAYYQYLFTHRLGGVVEVNGMLRGLYRKYENYPRYDGSINELVQRLDKIIHRLSYDFSNDTYTGNIEDYLK